MKWQRLGIALLLSGIALDRLSIRYQALTLPLALLSLATLLGAVFSVVVATITTQPTRKKRTIIWMGIVFFIVGFVLLPTIAKMLS